ncbi:hypothetical protein MEQU1_001974 [Malassezia equina]|uniref:Uncharacterized protein n=1 Tax=Malassezia equina TaxID=1381935 RepID=A0AAF0EEU2_9BASI|nr:hypothetical protein MEQU1_001974 [Malassezia equina]
MSMSEPGQSAVHRPLPKYAEGISFSVSPHGTQADSISKRTLQPPHASSQSDANLSSMNQQQAPGYTSIRQLASQVREKSVYGVKKAVNYVPRFSFFEAENEMSVKDPFHGFYVLFWICLGTQVLNAFVCSFESTGQILSMTLAILMSRDLLMLAMSDAVLVGQTFLCVPLVKVLYRYKIPRGYGLFSLQIVCYVDVNSCMNDSFMKLKTLEKKLMDRVMVVEGKNGALDRNAAWTAAIKSMAGNLNMLSALSELEDQEGYSPLKEWLQLDTQIGASDVRAQKLLPAIRSTIPRSRSPLPEHRRLVDAVTNSKNEHLDVASVPQAQADLHDVHPLLWHPDPVLHEIAREISAEREGKASGPCFAEITRFADREFYRDWWNSTTMEEFARDWNRPVHHFLLQHVYVSLIFQVGLSKSTASLFTFLLSSVFHELVMIVVSGKEEELVKDLRGNVKDVVALTEKLGDAVGTGDYDHPEGLSLLTVKVDALLAYIHHVALLGVQRLSGKSYEEDPAKKYIQNLVKLRLCLEKLRPMETRLRYQVEKLLQSVAAEEKHAIQEDDKNVKSGMDEGDDEEDEELDKLAFRPNPNAMAAAVKPAESQAADEEEEEAGVYRPPKLAPMMYDPDAHVSRKQRNKDRQPSRNAALLADLSAGMSSNPYETSVAGVGGGHAVGTAGSSRARALRRMQEFEEDNYKRLSLSKKDAKRRRRDEQDVALGGLGLSSHGNRIGGGVEEEFGDLLRGSERDERRRQRGDERDAYYLLQKRAKLPSTLSRAKEHTQAAGDLGEGRASTHKFKKAMRNHKRKSRTT